MTTTLNVTNAYLDWDNYEAVTVSLKRSTGTTSVSIARALRTAINRQEQQILGAMLTGQEVSWSVPNVLLTASPNTTAEMMEGDTITVGSEVWTVRIARKLVWGTVWRCTCVKERS